MNNEYFYEIEYVRNRDKIARSFYKNYTINQTENKLNYKDENNKLILSIAFIDKNVKITNNPTIRYMFIPSISIIKCKRYMPTDKNGKVMEYKIEYYDKEYFLKIRNIFGEL